jgi:predicted DNA-binding protein YlxM (UPF0122 family)
VEGDKMTGIYKYTNKDNGKIYIGRSVNITKRKWEHFHSPSPYSFFDQTLVKIGEDKFDFEIIEECSAEELRDREKYWIKFYNCCVLDSRDGGYNLTRGGEEYQSEENPWARLTMIQVNEIIDKLINTKISIQALAKEYGVHYNTISDINRCKTWAWAHNYQGNIREEAQGSLYRGELNGTAIISENLAKAIVEDIKYSKLSLAAIARKHSVKDSLVYDINRCRTWKHLHNYKNNIRNEFRKEGDAK